MPRPMTPPPRFTYGHIYIYHNIQLTYVYHYHTYQFTIRGRGLVFGYLSDYQVHLHKIAIRTHQTITNSSKKLAESRFFFSPKVFTYEFSKRKTKKKREFWHVNCIYKGSRREGGSRGTKIAKNFRRTGQWKNVCVGKTWKGTPTVWGS